MSKSNHPLCYFFFFFIATRTERFLQGDMFTTNYLLYKVLIITNYTKLTLLTVQYAAYTTYMTIKLFTTHYLQYNIILNFLQFNINIYNSAIQFFSFNTFTETTITFGLLKIN